MRDKTIDEWGIVRYDEEQLCGLLLKGHDIKDLIAVDAQGVQLFNKVCRELDHPEDALLIYQKPDMTVQEWDSQLQENWLFPSFYQELNVFDWLITKCSTQEQVERVCEEWILYEQRNLQNVLRCLIYLIDHFKANEIIWGVGRGSSVASYVLFLIGVHRVDSLKYGLDYKEFLR